MQQLQMESTNKSISLNIYIDHFLLNYDFFGIENIGISIIFNDVLLFYLPSRGVIQMLVYFNITNNIGFIVRNEL